jgi:hypothetical protein
MNPQIFAWKILDSNDEVGGDVVCHYTSYWISMIVKLQYMFACKKTGIIPGIMINKVKIRLY